MENQKDRLEKINTVNYPEAEKLIYEWVKKDLINFREFRELTLQNRINCHD